MKSPFVVITLVGKTFLLDYLFRDYVIMIGDMQVFTNLVVLDIIDYNIIIGMDWLS